MTLLIEETHLIDPEFDYQPGDVQILCDVSLMLHEAGHLEWAERLLLEGWDAYAVIHKE